MKAFLSIFFSILILAVSSAAQGVDKKEALTEKTGGIYFSDPAQPIMIKKGRTFSIHLASNPTTGYKWRIAGPLDSGILTESGHRYIRPASNLIGAGGKEIWKFRAVGGGKTTVNMEYIRPWEKNAEPAKKVSFSVTVSE